MKIVIFGDSIAEGLGVKGISYGDLLREEVEKNGKSMTLLNLAHTGYQISDSVQLLPRAIAFAPDIVIVAHGVTEAIIRPTKGAMRFVPKRWQPKGWLDPRPYYSRNLVKGIYQHIESAVRWRWKVILMRVFGGETCVSQSRFEEELNLLLENVLSETSAQIFLLTQCELDEKFFPGSMTSMCKYQHSLERAAQRYQETKRIRVCSLSNKLDRWHDFFEDHFHPNATGHQKIAMFLYENLREELCRQNLDGTIFV